LSSLAFAVTERAFTPQMPAANPSIRFLQAEARVMERQAPAGGRKLLHTATVDLGHEKRLAGKGEGAICRILSVERQTFRKRSVRV
jgi:hypothetical protein